MNKEIKKANIDINFSNVKTNVREIITKWHLFSLQRRTKSGPQATRNKMSDR